jgi:hypothetical protein
MASSPGAPAEAVFCFPIYEGSSDSLATEHLSDVGTRFTGEEDFSRFRVEPCSMLYPSRYRKRPLLFPTSHGRPSMGLPCGRLAMHCDMAE